MIDDGVSYKCKKYNLETTSEPCGKYACCEGCSFEDKMNNIEKISGGVAIKMKEGDIKSMEKTVQDFLNKKKGFKAKMSKKITKLTDIKEKKDKRVSNAASGTVDELAESILNEQAKKTPNKRGKYKKKTDGVGCECKKHIFIKDTQIESTPVYKSMETGVSDGIKRFSRVEKVVRVLEEVHSESSYEMDGIAILQMAAQIVFPGEIDIWRKSEIESFGNKPKVPGPPAPEILPNNREVG